MPPIDAIVAGVWAVFLTLVTLAMLYLTFVVSVRQEREAVQVAERPGESSAGRPRPAD